MHNHHRGQTVGGPEHGSRGLRASRRSEEVHERERKHQLSLLQRGTLGKKTILVFNYKKLLRPINFEVIF